MKSLILKDLYNIGHNAKSMIFILVVFAAAFLPTSGVEGYLFLSAIVCSMMIATTFTFDDFSGWAKYAMIMPVSRNELVAGKFVVLFLFSGCGVAFGLVLSLIAAAVFQGAAFRPEGIPQLLAAALAALVVAEIYGSMSIPLIFRFGSEKGRMLLLTSFIIPAALFFSAYEILRILGITVSESAGRMLLCASPLFALFWNYVMYRISCRIFSRREF